MLSFIKETAVQCCSLKMGEKTLATSLLSGFLSLLLCGLAWIILIPVFNGNQIEDFNPLQELIDKTFAAVHERLIENKERFHMIRDGSKEEGIKRFVQNLKKKLSLTQTFRLAMIGTITYACSCLLMMVGALSHKAHLLMLPYLAIQLLVIILTFICSVFLTSTFFLLAFHPSIYVILLLIILGATLPFCWRLVRVKQVDLTSNYYYWLSSLLCLFLCCYIINISAMNNLFEDSVFVNGGVVMLVSVLISPANSIIMTYSWLLVRIAYKKSREATMPKDPENALKEDNVR